MQLYSLRMTCFLCETSGHAVFLDVRRGTYLSLSADQVRLIKPFVRGWRDSGYEQSVVPEYENAIQDVLDMLLAAGILTKEASEGKAVVPVGVDRVETTIDHVVAPFPVVTAADLFRFIWAWVVITFMINVAPLCLVLRRIRVRKDRLRRCSCPFDALMVHRLMSAYFILRPNFFDAKDACLRDSLTFIEFLAHYDIFPTLVIGVRMDPFSAHSWVQEGAMVLNDYVKAVRRFEPILVI